MCARRAPSGQAPADQPLAGRRVFLPRLRDPDALAQALEFAGAQVLRGAVTQTLTTPDQERALARMSQELVAGRAAWLVLTSARTVHALLPHLAPHLQRERARDPKPPAAAAAAAVGSLADTRVAVVGPATARAWQEATALTSTLVARGSAAALLAEPELARGPGGSAEAAPAQARRVCLPASALADPGLAAGLRRAGWQVEQIAAYTTLTAPPEQLPAQVRRAWRDGGVDAVVLTAPSTARAVVELLGQPPRETRVVSIGTTTAQAASALGFRVAAVAAAPTPAGVCQAVEQALWAP